MKVSEIGEFGLIDRFNKMIEVSGINQIHTNLITGIGDDAAAWKCTGALQMATTDTLVQDVHFNLKTAAYSELGWKSLAINLSDIAAMGGIPRYTQVALTLPDNTTVEDITQLYQGIIDLAGHFKVGIVGGNISRGAALAVTITVIGESATDTVLKRSAARAGDVLAITGWPGCAAAGLAMSLRKLKIRPEAAAFFRNAFMLPIPRVIEGQLLVQNGITAAIDTSDGLLADLQHLCQSSQVSARVSLNKMPVHEMLAECFGEKSFEMALTGGEDYELLFTGSAESVAKLKGVLECPVNIIGEISSGQAGNIEVVDGSGRPVKMKAAGWTHF